MKTILKILSVCFIFFYALSCSKENSGINSKYFGSYEGNVIIQTSSGKLNYTGSFTVNSDGSVNGEIYNSDKSHKKTYYVSKGYIKKYLILNTLLIQMISDIKQIFLLYFLKII